VISVRLRPNARHVGAWLLPCQPIYFGQKRSIGGGNRVFRRHLEGMSNAPQLAEVAALVGDPARANVLCALLDGRARTATELAAVAGVSPQTTSGHLSKLLTGRLLVLTKQGLHRYYRLAGPQVAQMLEGIMGVALTGPPRFQPRSRLDETLRTARTCYDHIAGAVGVGLAARLTERAHIQLGEDAGEVTQPAPPSSQGLASTCRPLAQTAGFSAVRASIGLKGVRTLVALSAPHWRTGALS